MLLKMRYKIVGGRIPGALGIGLFKVNLAQPTAQCASEIVLLLTNVYRALAGAEPPTDSAIISEASLGKIRYPLARSIMLAKEIASRSSSDMP